MTPAVNNAATTSTIFLISRSRRSTKLYDSARMCLYLIAAVIATAAASQAQLQPGSPQINPHLPNLPVTKVINRVSTPQALLFRYVSNRAGFDTGITIANTSVDPFGNSGSAGSCTLHYYGDTSFGSTPPASQTTSSVAAGETVVFTLSTGGTHGVAARPSFQGYLIADCTFPNARGTSILQDLGASKISASETAEVISLPRSTGRTRLLFPYMMNKDGFDTGFVISNTSKDPFGNSGQSGSCDVYYYGRLVGGGIPPASQNIGPIAAGSYAIGTLSTGGTPLFAAVPGFHGYMIADCDFPNAVGYSFISDVGASKLATAQPAEVLPAARDSSPKPLLFRYVTNQAGFDTGITISNTSQDPFGTSSGSGTCTLTYYGFSSWGLPTPAPQTSSSVAPGETIELCLSGGGSHGIQATPNFQGYIVADCTFGLARGYSMVSDIGASRLAGAETPKVLETSRGSSNHPLLFPFVSNQGGFDTGLVISNTSADPLGTDQQGGTCTIWYYGNTNGGAAPAAQTTNTIAPGEHGIWTLSTGGWAGVSSPGFQGYIIADCTFPHAQGYAYISDIGASKLASAYSAEVINPSDVDNDGTPDYDDECPQDANKIAPGTCGCGAADTDSDGDGTADCNDACSLDPNKTSAGVCGCGNTDLDKDGDGTVDCGTDANGLCIPGASGSLDCAHEVLSSAGCVGANGFLGQINIATVQNLQAISLHATVRYLDMSGAVVGSAASSISANSKMDFIINDLGLQADTYGTVCVSTDAVVDGAWTGGITLYKPESSPQVNVFGDGFDFALYYPFTNSRSGAMTVPLNTYHLGTNPVDAVANWISITDAAAGDGERLQGQLKYYDYQGNLIKQETVNIPDGGRFDFAGHSGITSSPSEEKVGMASFVPNACSDGSPAEYYLTLTRYFYDCGGSFCTDFLTAFPLPYRPGSTTLMSGGASTLNNELSVLELINTTGSSAKASVEVFDSNGASLGTLNAAVPGYGTYHVILNEIETVGYLPANSVGTVQVAPTSGYLSAAVLQYKLSDSGALEYGYASALTGGRGLVQMSQFNSYIEHQNSLEIYNPTSSSVNIAIDILTYDGSNAYSTTASVSPSGMLHLEPALPADTYGTITVQAGAGGLISRSFVKRDKQYVLGFQGE